jgi:hypothetical protein
MTKEGLIVCGGPSLARITNGMIDGWTSLAVNWRPYLEGLATTHLVVCDPPHNARWQNSYPTGAFDEDYGTIKWIRENWRETHLVHKQGARLGELPNVSFFRGCCRCKVENYLPNRRVPMSVDTSSGGMPIDTMLAALKLMYDWGFRRVFLVACDYSHHHSDITTDEAWLGHQLWVKRQLYHLKPFFDAAGYEVLNATPGSELFVFPNVDLPARRAA